MTAVVVSFDGTRLTDADALSPSTPVPGVWEDTGGAAAVLDGDFFYQGSYSVSEKVKDSELGVCFIPNSATYDFTSGPKVLIAKVIATNKAVLNAQGSTGGIIEIGSGATAGSGRPSNWYDYYVLGYDNYPVRGGWVVIPIDPNISGYRDNTNGTVSLSAINYFAWVCTFTTSSKSENVAMDAVDYITSGTGLTLVSGDGADTDGEFQDFIDFDEGTSTNRYGIVYTTEGVLFVLGVLTIGSSTATEFTDSLKTLVFPDGRVAAGFFGLDIDLQNASTAVTIANCSLVSRGNTTTTDTRARLDFSGTSGAATINLCTIVNFAAIVLTSAVDFINNTVANTAALTPSTATITGNTFDSPAVATGVAFIQTADVEVLAGNMFISSGTGHAIEATATGTYDWDINHSGYSGTPGSNTTPASGSNDAVFYNNSGGAITLNVAAGADTPQVRNGAGATTTVVGNTITLQVTVLDDSTGSPIGTTCHVYLVRSSDKSVLLSGACNASGVISATIEYDEDTDVEGWAREVNLSGTDYEPEDISGQYTSSGFSATVRLKPSS